MFSLPPHFVQHIANAWTATSTNGKELHIQYVGYPEMPDFMSWSGPGKIFEDVDPDAQPPSRLMHAVLSLDTVRPSSGGSGRGITMESQQPRCPSLDVGSVGDLPARKVFVDSVPEPQPCGLSLNDGPVMGDSASTWRPVQPRGLPQTLEPLNRGITQIVCSRVLEFPCINPLVSGKQSQYVFGACSMHDFKNRPPQAIGLYDCLTGQCKIWSRGWRYYVGEPEMIPSLPHRRRDDVPFELDGMLCQRWLHIRCDFLCQRPHSPEITQYAGWILSICYDAVRDISEVIILDAANITKGPVATVALPFVLPHGLHGLFVPEEDISKLSLHCRPCV